MYKNNTVEVIANEQGNRATPAFLSFTPKERVVGEAAYNHQHLAQSNTLYHTKSLLGYKYNDEAFQKILAESKFPFTVLEGANGKPVVEVEFQGKETQFTAEELVSVLFRQMKQTASQYLGTSISKAVISVPTHYNDAQKAALLEAAKLAELEVLALCDEPAAVAMAYKLDEPPAAATVGASSAAHQHVVVVDCGGISTNITVLGVQSGIMEILGGDQDTMLGGEHIDEKLMTYFATEFKRKNDGLDLTQSARAMTRLRHGSEKAKQVLSSAVTAPIELDAVFEGADLFSNITRSKFEGLCVDFFKRITAALERALTNAGVEKDDIQSLIISGGSGKIPRVAQTIKNFFGHKVKVLSGVNADEAVAFGCAIQASLLVTADPEHLVSDVSEVKLNALSIGIENAAGELQVLIPKNTPLPTLKVMTATVNGIAKGGLLRLFEGEVIKSASANNLLGSIAIPTITGTTDIKVEVSMDVNSNIDVQITHSESRTRVQLAIPSGGKQLTAEQIAASIAAGHAEHEQLLLANKSLAAAVEVLELRGAAIKSEVSSGVASGALTAADQKIMAKAVDDVADWLATISVGPIIHAKQEDIDRKAKGLELLFASCAKKIEAAQNATVAAPVAAPKVVAPAPVMAMDTGDLD